MSSTHICGQECIPSAVNAIGVEIQTFSLPSGWKGDGSLFDKYCQARIALSAIPDDGVERRVYTALAVPSTKE